MNLQEHAQINSAVIALVIVALGGAGTVFTAAIGYLVARLHDATKRIDRLSNRQDFLSNGGGDAKIDARLREHGLTPPLPGRATTVIEVGGEDGTTD